MPIYSRREILRHSGFGALALGGGIRRTAGDHRQSSASPLSASQPHFPAKAKRIIHLFMNGGPSQVDTFDPTHNLQALDGQSWPNLVKNALQPTQRTRVGNIFASPFPFSRHGNSVWKSAACAPTLPNMPTTCTSSVPCRGKSRIIRCACC